MIHNSTFTLYNGLYLMLTNITKHSSHLSQVLVCLTFTIKTHRCHLRALKTIGFWPSSGRSEQTIPLPLLHHNNMQTLDYRQRYRDGDPGNWANLDHHIIRPGLHLERSLQLRCISTETTWGPAVISHKPKLFGVELGARG